nr:hypothetical protein [Tanacetum cinerariifolium]
MGPNGVVSLRTPRNEVLGFQGFNPSLDYFSWILFRDYRAKSCCYNGLYKEEVGDELKGGCPRSYVMQGASFTQGTVSSIPIGDSISPEGFLLPILLLVVIIVTVVIIAVILIVIVVAIVGVVIVVVIIRVVVVIDGVSSILKLSFVIIVTFPSMLLGLEIICLCLHGFDKELINLVLPDCLIEDEDFIKRSRSTHKTGSLRIFFEKRIAAIKGYRGGRNINMLEGDKEKLWDEFYRLETSMMMCFVLDGTTANKDDKGVM